MAFLDSVFNPLLLPLFNWNPLVAIVITSFVISLLIVVVYKLVTDQKMMKELKEKQKAFQKRLKELRSNPQEMMKVQKEAMSTNMTYMKQSFKPTLITMIPIFIIFGWLAGHLTYEPIYPGETYSVTAMFEEGVTGNVILEADEGTELLSDASRPIEEDGVTWRLKSDAGEHFFTVKTDNDEQSKKVLITKELMYEEAVSVFERGDISSLQINYNKLRPLGQTSIFGWQPGWLGLYIIFSIVFSIILRKLLKVY